MESGGRAARDDATAVTHRADRLLEYLATDVLDHDIDAALVGQLPALRGEILLRVVDPDVGAELPGARELVRARRGRDHARAVEPRDLDRGHADPRACA